MVLIPDDFYGNLQIGPRWRRAYDHREGAHTSRIPRKFTERTATAEGICTGMVLIPQAFHGNS
jgi:hypothetical protein